MHTHTHPFVIIIIASLSYQFMTRRCPRAARWRSRSSTSPSRASTIICPRASSMIRYGCEGAGGYACLLAQLKFKSSNWAKLSRSRRGCFTGNDLSLVDLPHPCGCAQLHTISDTHPMELSYTHHSQPY